MELAGPRWSSAPWINSMHNPSRHNHPLVPQLGELFGDHTFFFDANGLNIVEPTETNQASTWQVIKLASWEDATHTSLMPHDPGPTDVVFTLPSNGPDETA